jgi:hypothetical protein
MKPMLATWLYTIINQNGIVFTTTNTDFAEEKSHLGCKVLCKKISNFYKYY